MCGIAGFLDRTRNERAAAGRTILKMLEALGCRGPDSAGVALYGGSGANGIVVQVKLGERGVFQEKGRRVAERVREHGPVQEVSITGEYLRLVVDPRGEPAELARFVESLDKDLEVVSMGRRLEILKRVGSPRDLEAAYSISRFTGTHGIGHTRLSTESRVDLSHSQPFWARGLLDVATVHNGHVTNYHKLRRQYEQRGVRFYTENDSEVIGVYLAARFSQGMGLEEALKASLKDLDGSFSYLAATPDAIGFAKDPFALKPLLVAETAAFVALATEEIAIRAAFDGSYDAREAQAGEVRVWLR